VVGVRGEVTLNTFRPIDPLRAISKADHKFNLDLVQHMLKVDPTLVNDEAVHLVKSVIFMYTKNIDWESYNIMSVVGALAGLAGLKVPSAYSKQAAFHAYDIVQNIPWVQYVVYQGANGMFGDHNTKAKRDLLREKLYDVALKDERVQSNLAIKFAAVTEDVMDRDTVGTTIYTDPYDVDSPVLLRSEDESKE
jgi:hypothetical protein